MSKQFKLNIDKVLEDISQGHSVVKACKEQGCSSDSFYKLIDNDESLKDRYARACEMRGQHYVDSIDEDMEDLRVGKIDAQKARVLIDAKKWLACKMFPKMFGDKQAVEVSGKDGAPLQPPVLNILPVKTLDESK